MRSATRAVSLVLLSACSGGATDAPPPPSSAPPPSTLASAAVASASTLASEHPLGCTLAAVVDGRVVSATPDGPIQAYVVAHEADPAWIPLPTELASAAPEATPHATIVTTDGPCTATLGPSELHTAYEGDFADVGRAITGCASDVPFALLCPDGVAVPSTLRYAPFAHGELARLDASTTDPVMRSAYIAREYFGEIVVAADHPGYVEAVRGRSATIPIGPDRLAYVEVASSWFAPGTDVAAGCPELETLHAAVYAWPERGGDERVAESQWLVGVLHDGAHALALVESGSGDGAEECEGANTCTFVGLWTPARIGAQFVPRSRTVVAMGSGELTGPSPLLLTGTREGCDPED